MEAAYRIRPAVAADLEGVVALDRRIQNVPHWTFPDYLGALSPTEHARRPAGTRRCLLVACAGDSVVGFVVGRVTVLETEVLAELESVGVIDSARRAGLGRALCEAVITWVRGEGATEIELEVRSRSDGAIALYRGLGFEAIGVRPDYYRQPVDDAVLMRLDVAARSLIGRPPDRDL